MSDEQGWSDTMHSTWPFLGNSTFRLEGLVIVLLDSLTRILLDK